MDPSNVDIIMDEAVHPESVLSDDDELLEIFNDIHLKDLSKSLKPQDPFFVEKLVTFANFIIEAIWPEGEHTALLEPLRPFLVRVLKKSRRGTMTLQVALYYLILVRPKVLAERAIPPAVAAANGGFRLQLGREMFLASLILADKWLRDCPYTTKAWVWIAKNGEDPNNRFDPSYWQAVREVNKVEAAFWHAIDENLCIDGYAWLGWLREIARFTSNSFLDGDPEAVAKEGEEWRQFILCVTPQDLAMAGNML